MKIVQQNSIKSLFHRLLEKCESVTLAVAWANPGEPEANIFQRRSKKIFKMYVGTSFWHTDPDFIETYIDHPGCKFIKHENAVFHPKVYLFEHANGKWDGIIGSANFTRAAFASNQEVMIHWNEQDLGAQEARETLKKIFKSYEELPRFDSSTLHRYRAHREIQLDKMSSLSGEYDSNQNPSSRKRTSKKSRSLLDSEIFSLDWKKYAARVSRDTTVAERIEVMKTSRRLFQEKSHLADFSLAERKGVAGFGPENEVMWHWFGAMSGAGYYKQAINNSPSAISKALDEIPLQGEVTKSQYDAFSKKFTNAFQHGGVATATRLLAMKRPDVFLCMTKQNSRRLSVEFGIPKNVSLENYWDRIVLRIRDAIWWNSSIPHSVQEKEIWRARAAFLDSLFYENG
jgi:HKD family nuclease